MRSKFTSQLFIGAAAVCLTLVVSGCKSDLPRGSVDGLVLVDNMPLEGLLIVYISKSNQGRSGRAQGMTDAAGRYVLRGEDQRPGVPLGDYIVLIQDLEIYTAPRDADGTVVQRPPRRFPAAYEKVETTPLSTSVANGHQSIDFKIVAAP